MRRFALLIPLLLLPPGVAAAVEPAPPAVATDPHHQLDEILQRPMFRAWRDREEAKLPDVNVELPESFTERLRRVGRSIGDFIDWLFRSSGRRSSPGMSVGSSLPTILRLVAWLALGAAVIAIAVVLIRLLGNAQTGVPAAKVLSRHQVRQAMESGDALALDSAQWLDEARRLASEQNFRAVYRALYLALLAGLHARGKIEHSRNRTNWTYVRCYRGPTDERQTFADLTELFDRVWYGRKTAEGHDLDQLRAQVATLTRDGADLMRWLPLTASLAIAAVAVVLSYRSASVASRSGDDAPVYSTRRHDPYGTAAFQTLLAERGVPVDTLEQPTLDESDKGVLIQVQRSRSSPHDPGSRDRNTKQLADWIAQGNTVVQLSRTPTDLMARLKILPTTQPNAKAIETLEAAEADGAPPGELPGNVTVAHLLAPAAGARSISLRAPMEFADRDDARWTPLARSDRSNAVVAAEYHVGQGRLILVGAPTPALNAFLPDQSNLDFLLASVGAGPALFDEWSLGIGHDSTIVGFVRDVGLMPVLLQAALLAGLYVWSTSGAPRPPDPDVARQRSTIEQVTTLGFLYGRSLGPGVTFDRAAAEIRRRLADALRCRPTDITARAARLAPDLRAAVDNVLQVLAGVLPPDRVRCERCGYDLALNQSGTCPECGALIPGDARRRIADADAAPGSTDPARRRPNLEKTLAELLTRSHQLAREIERDRTVIR